MSYTRSFKRAINAFEDDILKKDKEFDLLKEELRRDSYAFISTIVARELAGTGYTAFGYDGNEDSYFITAPRTQTYFREDDDEHCPKYVKDIIDHITMQIPIVMWEHIYHTIPHSVVIYKTGEIEYDT